MEIGMLEEINNFYSEIVDRVDRKRTAVTHEYMKRHNALPLPATFTIDAGQRISKAQTGMEVRLYSDHPWRPDGGPKDDFERKTLQVLAQKVHDHNADLTHHEFTEIDGRPYLRFAKGQLMQQSCLGCHNDKSSPKQGWRPGDLVGVLVINRPLESDIARTESGLYGSFLLMGVVILALVVLCVGFVIRARLKSQG
jgi:hypothetical protein